MTQATICAVGGGWFHVRRDGITNPVRLARGRREADRLAATMNAEPTRPTPDLHAVYAALIDGGKP